MVVWVLYTYWFTCYCESWNHYLWSWRRSFPIKSVKGNFVQQSPLILVYGYYKFQSISWYQNLWHSLWCNFCAMNCSCMTSMIIMDINQSDYNQKSWHQFGYSYFCNDIWHYTTIYEEDIWRYFILLKVLLLWGGGISIGCQVAGPLPLLCLLWES